MILGTFVRDVRLGYNKQSRDDLMADTIRGYLISAHRYLQAVLGRTIPVMDPNHGGKNPRYHPFLSEQMSDQRRFERKKPRYEPFTSDMFEVLAAELSKSPDVLLSFLGMAHSTYDWTRLGVFAGFRVGEYGQNNLLAGEKFLTIPFARNVPADQRGKPVAFMASDFRFWSKDFIEIPLHEVFERHCKGEVSVVEIQWRYDKSAQNFVWRKFGSNGHPIFDPVDAAVSIIQRQLLLHVSSDHPIGVWSADGIDYRFLMDRQVTQVMRRAVDLAYPDPNHFMRRHRDRIVPHSTRVTAAVCLQLGGASNDEIAFKLRWHLSSVPTYLRECFKAIGDTLEKAVRGALKMAFSQ